MYRKIEPTKPYPPIAEAASVLLAILVGTKRNTLHDLYWGIDAGDPAGDVMKFMSTLQLSPHQIGILETFNDELHLIDRQAKVTVMACPDCHGWLPIEKDAGSATKCPCTAGCEGKMVRAIAAKRIDLPTLEQPIQDLPDPDTDDDSWLSLGEVA